MLRTVYDLNQITSRVNRLDKAFGVKNRRRLIKQASEDILKEIRRTFRTKASPDGEPWAKLAPRYQEFTNTDGDIGILSGLMLNSIPGKFANNSSSFLIRNNPCSGLSEKSKSSHFSPPTAPSNTA